MPPSLNMTTAAAAAISMVSVLLVTVWFLDHGNYESIITKKKDKHDSNDVENSSTEKSTAKEKELQAAWQESKDKLEETALTLRPFLTGGTLQIKPCHNLNEMHGYRCRFTLQFILVNQDAEKECQVWKYAIRKDQKPVPLEDDTYKFANPGLALLMPVLIRELNRDNRNTIGDHCYHYLTEHLTSVSFWSSWDSTKSRLVTFHYNAPLPEAMHSQWIEQANQLRQACGATLISGRAKKVLLRSSNDILSPNSINLEDKIGTQDSLLLMKEEESNSSWKVALKSNVGGDHTQRDNQPCLVAHFFKPEGAFCHPNAFVMLSALSWILNRIDYIHQSSTRRADTDLEKQQLQMLELYCGCGAHTIPIAKSGLVSKLTAIELDDRLVRACQRNIESNDLQHVIQVVSKDAGAWAKQNIRQRQRENGTIELFDILLVDPPRQGLDQDVRNLAMNDQVAGGIQDILYISCGREALVRDFQFLQKEFEIVNCTLLDLFPGTESVESLCHLQRRRR
eukprot:CAMPEP_0172448982 /NCGR_PEP_ID=MMETSP1065-20121228/7837_1 /TAXON_ID=265537 /ORGANISM="Amphiprora paludosa, Strain CCMP125" /LENGTH=508 /DNA_ID=CAMNT_0013200581 /DNA_START=145 /DNA_END=1671 /DNA_ORIENTATION=-